MEQTIAQQLNVKDFPFQIRDKNGNEIYWESSRGNWYKSEYDFNGNCIYHESSYGTWYKKEYNSNGKCIYYEDSKGYIEDFRPNPSCEGRVVEIDGKKYKLTKL